MFSRLEFEDYEDFCKRCKEIKKTYKFLVSFFSNDEVAKYKKIVYSKKMKNLHKNNVWDYLNDYISEKVLLSKNPQEFDDNIEEYFEIYDEESYLEENNF